MNFTENKKGINGLDDTIERVDARDKVISTGLGWNGTEIEDSPASFMKTYPFLGGDP